MIYYQIRISDFRVFSLLPWIVSPQRFPHRTDLLLASSSAVMHISADSRPPVRPPCPLFPCSTPSELTAFTQPHALSWDELQQHGGQADLAQCTAFSLPITVFILMRQPVHFCMRLCRKDRPALRIFDCFHNWTGKPFCHSACRNVQLLSSPALFSFSQGTRKLGNYLNKSIRK